MTFFLFSLYCHPQTLPSLPVMFGLGVDSWREQAEGAVRDLRDGIASQHAKLCQGKRLRSPRDPRSGNLHRVIQVKQRSHFITWILWSSQRMTVIVMDTRCKSEHDSRSTSSDIFFLFTLSFPLPVTIGHYFPFFRPSPPLSDTFPLSSVTPCSDRRKKV